MNAMVVAHDASFRKGIKYIMLCANLVIVVEDRSRAEAHYTHWFYQ